MVSSAWLQKLKDEYRLIIINWQEEKTIYRFNFSEYCIEPPDEVTNFWTDEKSKVQEGILNIELNRHESAVFQWKK